MFEKLPEGASYRIDQDGCYEWMSDVYFHDPELGTFTATADTGGRVVLRGSDVWSLVDQAESLDEVREAIYNYTGKAWTDEFNRLAGGAE